MKRRTDTEQQKRKSARFRSAPTKCRQQLPRFTPAEQRLARSHRIRIEEAEPCGWFACSEHEREPYYIFADPQAEHQLICACPDFLYHGDAQPGFTCKHIAACLRFIALQYLKHQYTPRKKLDRLR